MVSSGVLGIRWSVLVSVLLLVDGARAGDDGAIQGDFIMVGGSAAGRVPLDDGSRPGWVLGTETSFVRRDQLVFYGAYLDAAYDFGRSVGRFTVGPEIGILCLGIDGGYLLEASERGVRHGFVVRPMLTLGVVSFFFRFGHLVTGTSQSFGEIGALLKFPVELP